ncbi:MAG: hypothetical protein HYZ00_08945 [Candidatus Hydrogenedentes bacterium]|nr:hypothetical protein [Candidatus Hydrogenedentota bacterium]
MAATRARGSVVLFCLRFLVFVGVFVVVWWLLLPVYGWLLVQASGSVLRFVLHVPITYGDIKTSGILNTRSLLVFGVDQHEKALPIALLVTNVPPYLALVLATAGLTWARRLKIIVWGVGILALGHVLFIVYALKFVLSAQAGAAVPQQLGDIPTAVAQFYLTLPFLLWIIFAYWDRLTAYLDSDFEN